MKKTLLALAMAGVVTGCSTPPEAPEDPKLESTEQKVSYGMGLVLGERLGAFVEQNRAGAGGALVECKYVWHKRRGP